MDWCRTDWTEEASLTLSWRCHGDGGTSAHHAVPPPNSHGISTAGTAVAMMYMPSCRRRHHSVTFSCDSGDDDEDGMERFEITVVMC